MTQLFNDIKTGQIKKRKRLNNFLSSKEQHKKRSIKKSILDCLFLLHRKGFTNKKGYILESVNLTSHALTLPPSCTTLHLLPPSQAQACKRARYCNREGVLWRLLFGDFLRLNYLGIFLKKVLNYYQDFNMTQLEFGTWCQIP